MYDRPLEYAETRTQLGTFLAKVYGWMSMGLVLTAAVAMGVANSESMLRLIFGNRAVLIGLIIGELLLVIVLSAAIQRIPAALASLMFLLYAGLNGLTLSVIFLLYTRHSIATTFFVTGGTFGAMSLYGYFTKRDLTSLGNLAFMLLIGVIIGSVVNFFFASTMLYWIITYVGIAVFVGLTAYDTQRIKRIGLGLTEDGAVMQRAAVLGALRLYLDFINLFLLLLRLLGRRR